MLVGDAGQEQNAKADKRCLSLIGGEWDAFLAKMQMQAGKAPILAAPEHEGTLLCLRLERQQQLARLIPPIPPIDVVVATKSRYYPVRDKNTSVVIFAD